MPSLKQVANAIKGIYNTGEKAGEFAADSQIAYDYYNQMNDAGRKLVSTLGSGAGRDIDSVSLPKSVTKADKMA